MVVMTTHRLHWSANSPAVCTEVIVTVTVLVCWRTHRVEGAGGCQREVQQEEPGAHRSGPVTAPAFAGMPPFRPLSSRFQSLPAGTRPALTDSMRSMRNTLGLASDAYEFSGHQPIALKRGRSGGGGGGSRRGVELVGHEIVGNDCLPLILSKCECTLAPWKQF